MTEIPLESVLKEFEEQVAEAKEKVLKVIARPFVEYGFDYTKTHTINDETRKALYLRTFQLELMAQEPTGWNPNTRKIQIIPGAISPGFNKEGLRIEMSFSRLKSLDGNVPTYSIGNYVQIVKIGDFNEEVVKELAAFLEGKEEAKLPAGATTFSEYTL